MSYNLGIFFTIVVLSRKVSQVNSGEPSPPFFQALEWDSALRERVAEMLQKDTRVKGYRLGAWNEGGAGVTVADLS